MWDQNADQNSSGLKQLAVSSFPKHGFANCLGDRTRSFSISLPNMSSATVRHVLPT